jgi:4-aminobutyrate aminotransferase
VCIAAAMKTIDVIERGCIENVRRVGEFILNRTRDWPKKHRIVGDVRGLGLMIGIEFVRDQQTKERAPDLRDKVVDIAFSKGLLLLGCGPNTLRIAPPLVVDQEQADFALNIIEAAISEIEAA